MANSAGFDAPGNWYRGNLHTHTVVSDGRCTPAEAVSFYRSHGYDFLVQTLGIASIKRKTSQERHSRNGIGNLGKTGTREIMVHKTLRTETGEQALSHALFQMYVYGVLGQNTAVFENHRSDGSFSSPFGEFLVGLSGGSQGVEGAGPAWIGLGTSIQRRKSPYLPSLLILRFFQWICSKELKRTGKCGTKRSGLEGEPTAGAFKQRLTAPNLGL